MLFQETETGYRVATEFKDAESDVAASNHAILWSKLGIFGWHMLRVFHPQSIYTCSPPTCSSRKWTKPNYRPATGAKMETPETVGSTESHLLEEWGPLLSRSPTFLDAAPLILCIRSVLEYNAPLSTLKWCSSSHRIGNVRWIRPIPVQKTVTRMAFRNALPSW